MNFKIVTAKAPVNIAVIKYWGKRDEELILPINDSLSVTLSKKQMCAETTVAFSSSFTEDKMWLNGKEQDMNNLRLQNCLREIKSRAKKQKGTQDCLNWKVHICSHNNFPTAAGLASSAAGYACLVFALGKLYEVEGDLSGIARQGSGSACRSIYGGFVQWQMGEKSDGSDSIAVQIAPKSHWPELRVLVLVVSDQKKDTSSTLGMGQSVLTSEFLKYRSSHVVPQRIKDISDAILHKNFHRFAEITMKDSNQFHSVCMDTYPPIKYMNDISWAVVNLIHQYNSLCGENKVAYTFDAGPNACLYMLESSVSEVAGLIMHTFPPAYEGAKYFTGLPISFPSSHEMKQILGKINILLRPGSLQYIIHTEAGSGPQVIEDSTKHLLDVNGIPK